MAKTKQWNDGFQEIARRAARDADDANLDIAERDKMADAVAVAVLRHLIDVSQAYETHDKDIERMVAAFAPAPVAPPALDREFPPVAAPPAQEPETCDPEICNCHTRKPAAPSPSDVERAMEAVMAVVCTCGEGYRPKPRERVDALIAAVRQEQSQLNRESLASRLELCGNGQERSAIKRTPELPSEGSPDV